MGAETPLDALAGALVASCQPVPDGPTDSVEFIVGFALAARDGGARALRIEGVANVRAVTLACDLPVIGLVKRDLADTAVRITPFVDDAVALARAGAAIVAFDATDRRQPGMVAALVEAIHDAGALAMADIATEAEARSAVAAGADVVATTLSGYVGPGSVPDAPDLALVRACAALGRPVVAEGRYNAPALAAAAIRAGAHAVVVGSAMTRPEYIARWFSDAIAAARPKVVLALDIGGTKTAAALVEAGRVVERLEVATPRSDGPAGWLDAAVRLARPWRGSYARCAAAVSGLVKDGVWSAVNPEVLSIPPGGFPLVARLEEAFGVPALALNDAQAAAWGEYAQGAGQGRDLVFLTVSSGIGGGIVTGGRLVQGRGGLAGHLGQIGSDRGASLEARASGFALARAAEALGKEPETRQLLAAAGRGEGWAVAIRDNAVRAIADALADLQRVLDPDLVVVGGGIGLADGVIDHLDRVLAARHPLFRPTLERARLGHDAGLVGVADYADRAPGTPG
ncbi:MAG: putative N-acetylmannosamine-6-phosphate 2-epimerase [Burkholderiales bacterium]|nr:putative N-acetylmannosamine-6-phosphate 2-epimerase [Burkholderiales bacterium]